MDVLESSIRARIPFIHVTTTDLVHVQEVLEFIANGEVRPLPQGPASSDALKALEGEVFYTNMEDPPTAKMWQAFRTANKTLVFVNTKKSVLQLSAGEMYPPKPLVSKFLASMLNDPENADKITHCFGGMTLKEIYEVVKICHKENNGKVASKTLNAVRQALPDTVRGLTQVDTSQDFYQPPKELASWMDKNLGFFSEPKHPDLVPRGLMLDGPPGTGKSAAAKHIADTLGIPLFRADLGSAKGKYVGESEANLQSLLHQIDLMSPCVVLFDEMEKALKGHSGDSSGVTSSMLGAILWWLQEHKTQVFSVMTTNDLKVLPKELYRPGRIDAVMTFSGLDSKAHAFAFIDHLLKVKLSKAFPSGGVAVPGWVGTRVQDWVNSVFQGSGAVPQAEATTLVQEILKDIILELNK